jgi:hypothetical protein
VQRLCAHAPKTYLVIVCKHHSRRNANPDSITEHHKRQNVVK